MKRDDRYSPDRLILYAFGGICAVWAGLLIAPVIRQGLPGILKELGSMMKNPFRITLCGDSLRAVLACLLAYGTGLGIYLSGDSNYRRREEHGSARWGRPRILNRKYASKNKTENRILTQNTAIGLDGRKHRRNLNVLVCGGSGSGKTRFYAKPNIMNCNSSFCILDPKRTHFKDNICKAIIG